MNEPVIAACAAAIAAIFSALAAFCSVGIASRSLRQARIADRRQFNLELRHWINDCQATLTEFMHCCGTTRNEAVAVRLLPKLSALKEQGHMFFPDVSDTRYRPRILDWLVYTYDLFEQVPNAKDRDSVRETLEELRKLFRKDAQIALDIKKQDITLDDWQKYLESEWQDPSQSHPALVKAKDLTDELKAQHRRASAAKQV